MKRYDIINYFIQKNGYKSYLEIGLDQPKNCYDKIKCNYKQSVDPKILNFNENHRAMTSDEYFKKYRNNNGETLLSFDIIFIDGLHLSEQVIKDINNSLECLNENGMIVMHDCSPRDATEASRERTASRWNGDVWKAFAHFRATRDDLTMYTIDTDDGCGIIQRGTQALYTGKYETYNDLEENREEMLRLISPSTLEKLQIDDVECIQDDRNISSKPFIDVKIPFEPGKRLGYAIDRAMKTVDDWVLILDHDVFISLNPHWYEICQNAIENIYDNNVGWITCVTNQIGCPIQKADYSFLKSDYCYNKDYDDKNMDTHFVLAEKLYKTNRGKIKDITEEAKRWKLSGVFILTRKKVYDHVKREFGIPEDKFIGWDNYYNDRLLDLGYKMYLMQDLYVYHGYKRLWKNEKWGQNE